MALGRWRPLVLLLVGLFVGMAMPSLGAGHWIAPGTDLRSMEIREVVFWAITAALLFHVTRIEGLPLSSLGFRRPTIWTAVWGVVCGLLIAALFRIIAVAVLEGLHLKGNAAAARPLFDAPLWFRVLLVLRAAVTEEILYRAYPIERIVALTGSRWRAVLVSVLGFSLAHLEYWGPVQLLLVAPAGLVLALLYLWRRDIGCNMLAHFITDGIGLLVR
ncbi:MAG TPA: CPBP family intramembrane glutamic endopeptidase [Caulobacteraceae bacterium]|jgi:membrane protease YdiL (CAAX protease family)